MANLLTGDPTPQFALKAVSILFIAGCIFGYYFWEMRRTEDTVSIPGNAPAVRLLLAIIIVAVVGSIGYALYLMGSPDQQRNIRLDTERVYHLSNIADNIDTYWDLNEGLPQELTQLSGRSYRVDRIHDPETGEPYEYRVLEGSEYELCAVFATDTDEVGSQERPFSRRAWDHGAGRHCFQLEARAP